MRTRSLLLSAALLPLAACFEVTIPGEPEPEPAPAELQNGEWLFDMEMVAADGDCWAMGLDVEDPYLYEYVAWAWIETDGHDRVGIDLEGFYLEGSIYGESLYADGELYYDYGYSYEDEPAPMEDEDDWGEDESDEDVGEPGYDPSSGEPGDAPVDCLGGDGDAEILPICEESYPEDAPLYEEGVFASMDADILSNIRMQGHILVDYVYFDTYCTVEFAFEAKALDEDPCDCDCCCDDDDHPVAYGEAVEGSSGDAPE
jgi:hypothetical protein